MGEAAQEAAAGLIAAMRAAGVPAETSFEDRPMKAQIKMADRAGADFVAIVGDQELAAGVVTLRRLTSTAFKTSVPADG